MSSPVREDRDGSTAGESVGLPGPWLGSYVENGETLKASKREAAPKMSLPTLVRKSQDPRKTTWLIDRRWTPGNRCS
jgi:hypothetical protein